VAQKKKQNSGYVVISVHSEEGGCWVSDQAGVKTLAGREFLASLASQLDAIERRMRKHGWKEVEIPLSPDDVVFIDDQVAEGAFGHGPKFRQLARSLLWNLGCHARFQKRQADLDILAGEIERVEREIVKHRAAIRDLRRRIRDLHEMSARPAMEAAVLSVGLKVLDEQPPQTVRDRESARLPRGRHTRHRATAK
jgi:hypothetical protein